MKTVLVSGFLVVFCSSAALADEVPPPEFKTSPLEFTNTHQIAYLWDNNRAETVTDTLLVGNETETKATIYLRTTGNNHHMCHVSGEATKSKGLYVYTYQACTLHITQDTKQAKVVDVNEKCKAYFCGNMAYLNANFKRK